MPKKVLEELLRQLRRDIRTNYAIGDKYLPIRTIAARFNVSLQSAQRAVTALAAQGILASAPRSGITVVGHERARHVAEKTIAVISNQHDKRFDNAFVNGIRGVASQYDVTVNYIENSYPDTSNLGFGDHLLSIGADGVIALAFMNSALPFYHAIREGLDVVVDIILDDLPLLAAVQTDNFTHAQKAAHRFLEGGYEDVLVAGYWPLEMNKRFKGLVAGMEQQGARIRYICLREMNAMATIDHHFHNFTPKSAVFSTDYATNYILAAKFIQHRLTVQDDNFLVYDSEEQAFEYEGLPPIRAVGPSLTTIGEQLCEALIYKWRTGAFAEPMQRKF